MTLGEVLSDINAHSALAWLYLPRAAQWSPETEAAILVSDEVPPDEEDEPEAGVPEYARLRGLQQVLPVTVVQDVLAFLAESKPHSTPEEKVTALTFYFDYDAFGP